MKKVVVTGGAGFVGSHIADALVIGRFLKQRLLGEPLTITGDGTQTRDFTHVRDVVSANLRALLSTNVGKGEVINIGSGNAITISELADHMGATERVMLPARVEAKHTLADIRKAKELLDWEPRVPFAEGLAELTQQFGV